jgi:hypothetical protein
MYHPTCAVAERVASLQHEALDDAVEDEVVVVPVGRVRCEVLHCPRAQGVGSQVEIESKD